MNEIVILSLLFISLCIGILFIGSILFFYISIFTRSSLYLSILVAGILGLSVLCNESLVIISGLFNKVHCGMQFHRLQALSISLYLFALPFICHQLLELNYSIKKINRYVYISGVCTAAAFIVSAFVIPDSFLSFVTMPGKIVRAWNAGRATPGILYRIRDTLIFLMGMYCLALIFIELKLNKRFRYLRLFITGLLIGMSAGVIDLVFAAKEIETGLYSLRIFSFFTLGITVFTILSMISIIKVFISQERSLEKARRNDYWGLLAGGIVHDFNNILTGIMGYASLAMLNMRPGEKNYEYINQIQNASGTAKKFIGQLHAFAKSTDIKKNSVDAASFIKDTVSFVLQNSNITAGYSFALDLWNAYIDKNQIFQVIQNLALNAIQAMPDGGLFRISAENYIKTNDSQALHAGRYLKISFHDEGIGIHKKHLNSIFEPYFSTKKEGTGLGLAISYYLIKKHDGHIEASSEAGKSSTFTIYLPAIDK